MIDRPKFKEMTYGDVRFYDKNYPHHVEKYGYYDSVELKMDGIWGCLLYTSPSPRDATLSRMPSSA